MRHPGFMAGVRCLTVDDQRERTATLTTEEHVALEETLAKVAELSHEELSIVRKFGINWRREA